MNRNKYQLVILFFLMMTLAFGAGYHVSNQKRERNLPPNSHNITDDDIRMLSSSSQLSGRISYTSGCTGESDVVPNETIAVKLGLLLLESVYGSDIYEERPYNVALLDSVWVVETSLQPTEVEENHPKVDSDMEISYLTFGGVGHVEINKHTGKVYTLYHTK